MFAQNLYNLAPEHVGRVVQALRAACEAALRADDDGDPEGVIVDVNAIDDDTFWRLDAHVEAVLPGGERYTRPEPPAAAAVPRGRGGGGGGGGARKRGRR